MKKITKLRNIKRHAIQNQKIKNNDVQKNMDTHFITCNYSDNASPGHSLSIYARRV